MNRFYGILCGATCGLMLLCFFEARLYAEDSCLTDVLLNDTEVYAVFTNKDMKLDFQIEGGEELGAIPKEYLNAQSSALAKAFEFTLPSQKAKGTHNLNDTLEVQAQSGQRYRLQKDTKFDYILPAAKSGYKVTIPAGTPLTIKDNPPEYALAEDIVAKIEPPKNYNVTLTVGAQSIVERVPGTSSMGTTLKFPPGQSERAPVGEYITVDVEKSNFDFSKAQFNVCLRKHSRGESSKDPFTASNDVELKEVQIGKAKLKFQIPDINERGVHFAKPVDLLVVARGPDDQMAEVFSQKLLVSSRMLAIICWILAFVFPWLIAGAIMGNKKRKQRFRFDPIWFVSGKYGHASLSLAQILLWSMLVFSASFYVWVVSGKLLDLTPQVLVLLGIAGGSSVIAKITASGKDTRGRELAGLKTREPKWLDLVQTEGRLDLYKVQMALFTTLAVFFVTGKIYTTLVFPELPAGLLTLIGISNGVYLGAKATSKTAFEKLMEKSDELQKAKDELDRRKVEADEAEKRQKKAENEKTAAITLRDSTQDKYNKEADVAKKAQLTKLLEQQKASADKAENGFKEADKQMKEAVSAKDSAERRVKDLKDNLDKLMDEATK